MIFLFAFRKFIRYYWWSYPNRECFHVSGQSDGDVDGVVPLYVHHSGEFNQCSQLHFQSFVIFTHPIQVNLSRLATNREKVINYRELHIRRNRTGYQKLISNPNRNHNTYNASPLFTYVKHRKIFVYSKCIGFSRNRELVYLEVYEYFLHIRSDISPYFT